MINTDRPALRIRLLSPLGHYPAEDLQAGNCRLVIRDDIAFSAVPVAPLQELPDECWTELEICSLEEIRFLACIGLALHRDRGMFYTYPLPLHLDLPLANDHGQISQAWDEENLVEQSKIFAASLHVESYGYRGAVLPPVMGGPPYALHEEIPDHAGLARMLDAVHLDDWLALRGLGALLKADMLWQRPEFRESAVMALHVAMEASFEMVREVLRVQGNANPSAHDAGAYLDSVFNPHLATGPYFRDWYQDRIRTSHPASRFGVFPFAPLAADDYYDLRDSLNAVYFHLLTGQKQAAGEDSRAAI